MTLTRILVAVVAVMSVALLADPLTVGPTLLMLTALALYIYVGVLARRSQHDRQIATMQRQTAAQIAHDVNRTNAYHHRRNVR